MARIYSGKKGKSASHKPLTKFAPKWIMYKKDEVEKLVVELAEKKYSSAQAGAVLRDAYGIPDVKQITGKPISKIMKEAGNYPGIPEDMMFLLRKAVSLRAHLGANKKDKHSRRGLQNLESQIRRLSKYYIRSGKLDRTWKYDPEQARLIIQKW